MRKGPDVVKPKTIVRAEQLLALAAYNPEGEEARSAAMLLVRHIVRNGLIITEDGYKQQAQPPPEVHYQPPPAPPPPAEPAEKKPRKPRKPRQKKEAPKPVEAPPKAEAEKPPQQEIPKAEVKQPTPDDDIPQKAEPYIFLVAKFKGVCLYCRGPIRENDHIAWMPGAVTHDKCAEKYTWPAEVEPERPWL